MPNNRAPQLPRLKVFYEDDDPAASVLQVVTDGQKLSVIRFGNDIPTGLSVFDITDAGIVLTSAWSKLENPQSGADLLFTITATKLNAATGVFGIAPTAANWSTILRSELANGPLNLFYDITKTQTSLINTLGKGNVAVFNDVTQ